MIVKFVDCALAVRVWIMVRIGGGGYKAGGMPNWLFYLANCLAERNFLLLL